MGFLDKFKNKNKEADNSNKTPDVPPTVPKPPIAAPGMAPSMPKPPVGAPGITPPSPMAPSTPKAPMAAPSMMPPPSVSGPGLTPPPAGINPGFPNSNIPTSSVPFGMPNSSFDPLATPNQNQPEIFESPVADILEIDIMSGRIPKMEVSSTTTPEEIKQYLNQLSSRKEQLLVYEKRLNVRKEEIEAIINSKKARIPSEKTSSKKSTALKVVKDKKTSEKTTNEKEKKETSKTSKKTALKVVKKTTTKDKKEDKNKKVEVKKNDNKIDVNQKHTIVTLKEFNEYDYDKRLNEWRKKAGHNAKQVACSSCKEKDNWETIKLEDGKHICFNCWIKKPTTSSTETKTKPVVVKKDTKSKAMVVSKKTTNNKPEKKENKTEKKQANLVVKKQPKEKAPKLLKHKKGKINENLGKVKPNKKSSKLVTVRAK